MVEEKVETGGPVSRRSGENSVGSSSRPLSLAEIDSSAESRTTLESAEMDRLLGGGIVEGSLVLIAGEPGIGKSTLSLQIPLHCRGLRTLYVTGEESARQVKLRAARLGGDSEGCLIYSETLMENIMSEARRIMPDLMIVDSIQTVYTQTMESSPGSVSQIKECASMLLRLAKETGGKRLLVSDVRKLLGRMHQDFLDYMASHPAASSVQLDSVIGKAEDRKAILTVTWPESNFQIGLLVDKGDPSSARKAILKVMRALRGAGLKCDGFPMEACLSDNGTEFYDYWKVEEAMAGAGISVKTFYARPMRSDDKTEAERNHELVRYIFPKGKSLDGLTQADLDSAFSNINSYVRRSKGDKTPFELAEAKFGRGFCEALRIRKVDKKKVRLLPAI